MKELLNALIISQVCSLPFYIILYIKKRAKDAESKKALAKIEENDRIKAEIAESNAEVDSCLRRAYFGLKKQGAAGFGPWMATCLAKIRDGGSVPKDVAITAMRMTISDIRKYTDRWDMACVYDCIEQLEGVGA